MLDFLYSKDFSVPAAENLEATSKELVKIYSTAYKYGLNELKELTLEKLEREH